MKRVLIIDDADYKADLIKAYISDIDNSILIDRVISRNSGLIALADSYSNNEMYDLVIIDNYLPIFDSDVHTAPYAKDIVQEIRRKGYDISMCICSSSYVPGCINIPFILFDTMHDLREKFSNLIANVFGNK